MSCDPPGGESSQPDESEAPLHERTVIDGQLAYAVAINVGDAVYAELSGAAKSYLESLDERGEGSLGEDLRLRGMDSEADDIVKMLADIEVATPDLLGDDLARSVFDALSSRLEEIAELKRQPKDKELALETEGRERIVEAAIVPIAEALGLLPRDGIDKHVIEKLDETIEKLDSALKQKAPRRNEIDVPISDDGHRAEGARQQAGVVKVIIDKLRFAGDEFELKLLEELVRDSIELDEAEKWARQEEEEGFNAHKARIRLLKIEGSRQVLDVATEVLGMPFRNDSNREAQQAELPVEQTERAEQEARLSNLPGILEGYATDIITSSELPVDKPLTDEQETETTTVFDEAEYARFVARVLKDIIDNYSSTTASLQNEMRTVIEPRLRQVIREGRDPEKPDKIAMNWAHLRVLYFALGQINEAVNSQSEELVPEQEKPEESASV